MAKRTRKAAKAVTRKNPATAAGARAVLERMGEQAMTTASRAKAKAKKAVKTLKTSKKAQAAAAAAGIAVAALAAGLAVRRARKKK